MSKFCDCNQGRLDCTCKPTLPPAVSEFAVSERARLLAENAELRAQLERVHDLFALRENDDGLWLHLHCDGKHASINLNTIHTMRWFVAAYCSKNPRGKS